jgi:hypothetical protein
LKCGDGLPDWSHRRMADSWSEARSVIFGVMNCKQEDPPEELVPQRHHMDHRKSEWEGVSRVSSPSEKRFGSKFNWFDRKLRTMDGQMKRRSKFLTVNMDCQRKWLQERLSEHLVRKESADLIVSSGKTKVCAARPMALPQRGTCTLKAQSRAQSRAKVFLRRTALLPDLPWRQVRRNRTTRFGRSKSWLSAKGTDLQRHKSRSGWSHAQVQSAKGILERRVSAKWQVPMYDKRRWDQ